MATSQRDIDPPPEHWVLGMSDAYWKYQDDVVRTATEISDPLTLMIECEREDEVNALPQGTTWQLLNAPMSEQLNLARGPKTHP